MLTSLTMLVCCLGNPIDIKGTYYGDHLFDLFSSIRDSINANHLWSPINSIDLWHLSSYMQSGKTQILFHESIPAATLINYVDPIIIDGAPRISYGDPSIEYWVSDCLSNYGAPQNINGISKFT